MKVICAFLGVAAAAAPGGIGKVVGLVQNMEAETKEAGQKEDALYATFVEDSRVQVDETEDSIQNGERDAESHSADAENGDAEKAAADAEVQRLAGEIAQGDADLSEAKDLKAKQAADCAAGEKELQDTLDQLIRATAILKRNFDSTALIQGSNLMQIVSGLKTVISATSLEGSTRSQLSALVEEAEDDDGPGGAPEGKAYQSKVGAVIDACEQLRVEAEDKLRELRRDCQEKAHNSAMTMQKLADKLEVDNKDLNLQKQAAATAEEAANSAKGKLAETNEGLASDRAMLAELKKEIHRKEEEHTARTADRQKEIAAMDKALEILTARFGSFLQVGTSYGLNKQVRHDVAQVLSRYSAVALQQLANRIEAANDPFGKVRGMIKDMVAKLEKQAADEADHNAWCNKNMKETKSKRDSLQAEVDKFSARAAQKTAAIDTLKEEIATLSGEVTDLERQRNEATALRQQESGQFAKEHEQTEGDVAAINEALTVLREEFGGEAGATGAGNSDKTTGILGMLEVVVTDMTEADVAASTQNNENQRAFDELMQKIKVSLAQKSASIKAKESEVSSTDTALQEAKQDADGSTEELEATLKTLDGLRKQCEHKPMTFAERAAKRQQEIEGLKEALRVLNEETAGAGEFLQKRVAVHEQ